MLDDFYSLEMSARTATCCVIGLWCLSVLFGTVPGNFFWCLVIAFLWGQVVRLVWRRYNPHSLLLGLGCAGVVLAYGMVFTLHLGGSHGFYGSIAAAAAFLGVAGPVSAFVNRY